MKDDNLICVNDSFPNDYLEFYIKHNVKIPKEGKIYTCRDFSRNSEGNMEILLNELINPEVPIKHKVLNIAFKEPAWKSSRFTTLLGEVITEEMLLEMKKEANLERVEKIVLKDFLNN